LHDNGPIGSSSGSYFVSYNNYHGFQASGEVNHMNIVNCDLNGFIAVDFTNQSGVQYASIHTQQFHGCATNSGWRYYPAVNGGSEIYFHTTPYGGSATGNFVGLDRRKHVLTLAHNQWAYFQSGVWIKDRLEVLNCAIIWGNGVLASSRTRFGGDYGASGYHWFASRDYAAGEQSLGYGFNQTSNGRINEHSWNINGSRGMYLDANSNLILCNPVACNSAWIGLKLVQSNKEGNTCQLVGQYIDFANELSNNHSSMHSTYFADGSSELRFLVTPAGARTSDRRVCALKINSDKSVTFYGNASIGDTSTNTVTSRYAKTTHDQGAYLEWNKDNGGGKTYLLNQRGLGAGGFVVGEVTTANTISERLTIDGYGHTRILVSAGGVDNDAALGLQNAAASPGQLYFYPSVDVGAYNGVSCACDALILYTRNGVNTACGLVIASHSTACNGIRIDNCTNIGIAVPNASLYGPNVNGTNNESAVVRNISIKKDDNVLTMGSYWKNGIDQYSYISSSSNGNTYKTKLSIQPCCGSVFIGSVGYGLTSGTSTLINHFEIASSNSYLGQIAFRNTGISRGSGFMIGTNSANTFSIMNQSGKGVCLTNGGTSWVVISDENKKDIIEYITGASEKISTLRTVIGKYKDDSEDTRRSFLIAQDVQKVLPEAVSSTFESGTLGLSYTDTIPLIVAAIKEMKLDIENIKVKLGI
jgi:hypothetical protein